MSFYCLTHFVNAEFLFISLDSMKTLKALVIITIVIIIIISIIITIIMSAIIISSIIINNIISTIKYY